MYVIDEILNDQLVDRWLIMPILTGDSSFLNTTYLHIKTNQSMQNIAYIITLQERLKEIARVNILHLHD